MSLARPAADRRERYRPLGKIDSRSHYSDVDMVGLLQFHGEARARVPDHPPGPPCFLRDPGKGVGSKYRLELLVGFDHRPSQIGHLDVAREAWGTHRVLQAVPCRQVVEVVLAFTFVTADALVDE